MQDFEQEDPLELLGLGPDASWDEIRAGYRRLVRKHRPERDPEGFQRLRKAYEVLEERQASQESPEEVPEDDRRPEARSASELPILPWELPLEAETDQDRHEVEQDPLEGTRLLQRFPVLCREDARLRGRGAGWERSFLDVPRQSLQDLFVALDADPGLEGGETRLVLTQVPAAVLLTLLRQSECRAALSVCEVLLQTDARLHPRWRMNLKQKEPLPEPFLGTLYAG